jgi:hypothetical protein
MSVMVLRKGNEKARIVQFADEGRTLPDGSKIVYAENDDKIVLYHKHPLDRGTTYVYDRKSGKITVNGKEGTNQDKKLMIRLGSYMLDNVLEYELVTVSVTAQGTPS